MGVETIQIGIDLGTTNSSIAINSKGTIDIIKKPGGNSCTPSVFGFHKSGNKIVGRKAYEALFKDGSEEDNLNYVAEVKRLMGTPETRHFQRPDIDMGAEEISAEILKGLKEDLLKKYPQQDTSAVVITIPAAFSVLQSEATKKAGNLAGFKHVVLLQEPIAAAIAYGFMSAKNENWLIYDLGGGTFDVALISCHDGILSVLSHNGDNFLGGKNFDLEIVDNHFVPRILQEFKLENFNRGNAKYAGAFSRLKYLAEVAKIELSEYEDTTVEIENIGRDDAGKEIYLSVSLSRAELESLIAPLVDRTVKMSQKTIQDAGISKEAVKKIVLVGGLTQTPYIQSRLKEDLGIDADSSIDPLTIVAKGASIFAISQKIPAECLPEVATTPGQDNYTARLNYESLSSDTEESISGVVTGLDQSQGDYFIQIQSESGSFNGEKIRLQDGKFFESIVLEENKSNLFWLYLIDSQGNTLPLSPDSFTITHGLSVSGAPIPHSVGVGVAQKGSQQNFELTDTFEKIFEKGSILPLEKTESFKTARLLKKAEDQNPLLIKVREGESNIPDRNTFICDLGIKGSDLPYDLPGGSDIDITIKIDESRSVEVAAYIPLMDITINARATFKDETVNIAELEKELAEQKTKSIKIKLNCTTNEKVEIDQMLYSAAKSILNARLDEDEKRKASKEIKDLKINLDKYADEKKFERLIFEFHTNLAAFESAASTMKDEVVKKTAEEQIVTIKAEGEKAIKNNEGQIIVSLLEQIKSLQAQLTYSDPAVWIANFRRLISGMYKYSNQTEANHFFELGKKAIDENDMPELKRCTKELYKLMPPEKEKEKETDGGISGITR